ncbi:MAG: hypothetical protein ATN31_09860 [Candidatus Epulonipiscioides saccharophilum]|nr:MAG: hypothetical protein ATN31_09860 [Epulopiscium sp. AS2M-Bin001]
MKPNVILFNIDDLGYSDISCYGSKKNETPNIDKLAENGIQFTNFYASASLCTPSRAGLMTGTHPKRLDFMEFNLYKRGEVENPIDAGVLFPGQPEGLRPDEKTIGNLFKSAGYKTKLVGKWHLGDQEEHSPLNFGFDSFFGLPYSNDMGIRKEGVGAERLLYTMCPLPVMENNKIIQEQPDCCALAERLTTEAINFVKDSKDEPFFLYFAHYYVHNPIYVSSHFLNKSNNDPLGGAVASIDWTIGAINYELEKLGLLDNTMIIFMSDNGGNRQSSNFPLKGFKGSQWEGGHRVNCIIQWNNVIRQPRMFHGITSMVDIFPTFAHLLEVDINDGIPRDGVSFLNCIFSETEESRRDTWIYYNRNKLTAIRVGDFKLHLYTNELYDLKVDVGEEVNLYSTYPEIVEKLDFIAQEYRLELGDGELKGRRCREKGFVQNFKPLTVLDPLKPYIVAEYD